MDNLGDLIIVAGHYGCGKTNLAVNLAVDAAKNGTTYTLADLDIVNPYFRSADFRQLADRYGFSLIVPQFATSNLDVPALTGELDAAISSGRLLVVDVGGDDAGAIALGRYSPEIEQRGYRMLYVINEYRPMIDSPALAVALMKQIEAVSRLEFTDLVNNSNLAQETTVETIKSSLEYAQAVSQQSGLPLLCTTVPRQVAGNASLPKDWYPVNIYVTTPW